MRVCVKNLSFSYEKEEKTLDSVSFELDKGESLGIIGANGAGKSTLLKILVGLEEKSDGEIRIGNWSLKKGEMEEIRKRTGYIFQDTECQLFMTKVYDEVLFAPINYGYSRVEAEKRAEEALEKIHISHLKDRQIFKLSGGEKKLVSIAAVLSMRPELLLMDEPTIALDPGNRRNLIRVLNGLKETKIVASHDLDFVMDTCKEVALLADGKIIRMGKTSEILCDKQMLEAYGLELPLSLAREGMKK